MDCILTAVFNNLRTLRNRHDFVPSAILHLHMFLKYVPQQIQWLRAKCQNETATWSPQTTDLTPRALELGSFVKY
jgi:hypothetical protein